MSVGFCISSTMVENVSLQLLGIQNSWWEMHAESGFVIGSMDAGEPSQLSRSARTYSLPGDGELEQPEWS